NSETLNTNSGHSVPRQRPALESPRTSATAGGFQLHLPTGLGRGSGDVWLAYSPHVVSLREGHKKAKLRQEAAPLTCVPKGSSNVSAPRQAPPCRIGAVPKTQSSSQTHHWTVASNVPRFTRIGGPFFGAVSIGCHSPIGARKRNQCARRPDHLSIFFSHK